MIGMSGTVATSLVASLTLASGAVVEPRTTTPLPELVGVDGESLRPPDRLSIAPPPAPIVVDAPAPVRTPTDDRRVPTRASAYGQLGAGATLLGIGLAGVGVLGGGLFLQRAYDREQDRLAARPDVDPASLDLGPLEAQGRRAKTMIGAGTVMTAAGLALGTALVITGSRAVHRYRRAKAELAVAPTIGGAVISGRF